MTCKAPLSRTCLSMTIISIIMTAVLSRPGSTSAEAWGVPQENRGKFRLLRSISGSKGHEEGQRYVMDDPRTVFRVPDDRQILVYLEWEGVAGRHEFEGHWTNPAGKVVVISDFKLEVRQKNCAGFFTMLLSETTETGVWTLEARVDGEITGHHKFQIVSSKDPAALTETEPPQTNPANPTTPPPEQARQPLAESKIYELANAATVFVEKLDAKDQRIDTGSGFLIEPDVMLTAFQVIDGATKLRVSLPDGRRIETQEALSWDRWQDLALLKVDSGQKGFIRISSNVDAPVGSRVFALAVAPEGARVIVRCDVVGKNRLPQTGERINLNCSHPNVIGSPLLNEYGDLIGVVGGSLIPGMASTKSYYSGAPLANPTPGLLAVPVKPSGKASSTNAVTSFHQLASGGVFTPALTRSENVQWGTLSRRMEAKPFPRPLDETHEFRSKDGSITVFLTWQPKEKIKAAAIVRIYDLDGRVLLESKPSKVDLKPGKAPSYSWWQADIKSLKPAIYRVDVLVDSSPIWRGFFKVSE
jgi:S1-C subfamily serine protease